MLREQLLRGRHIAVLAADGFEKVELTIPVKALRAAGAQVEIISLRRGRIRGVNLHEPAGKVRVSLTVDEAHPADYDGLFIPGGLISPDLLRQSAAARSFVSAFDEIRKPIASTCHGPWVLISAGLAKGRTMTAWPGIRDDVVNAGATWLDEDVVRDGNWVTSRGPQDLAPFVRAITGLFAEAAPIEAAAPQQVQSSPQRDLPPRAMITAMKWLPRPSFRTAAGLALLAGGWLLVKQHRSAPRTRFESFAREPVSAPL